MAGKPISLMGHMHICPMVDPGPKPHVGGQIVKTQSLVKVSGIPVAVVGDKCMCTGVPIETRINSGSSVATIDGINVARMGDDTEHGGKIVEGVSWVTVE